MAAITKCQLGYYFERSKFHAFHACCCNSLILTDLTNKTKIIRRSRTWQTRRRKNRYCAIIFSEVVRQKTNPFIGTLDLTSEVTSWHETLKSGSKYRCAL